jgi:hypothetical protein
MPEVRGEVVDAFKARIQSGHYPSQDIVEGLLHLVGGAIAQQAKGNYTWTADDSGGIGTSSSLDS